MSVKFDTVIVFGPTGSVGGHVAFESNRRGAKTFLGMRDPAKHIPLLDNTENLYHRIKTDLSDPEACSEAVGNSGAKAAFIYFVPTQDGMKASLSAMKDAGLEYVVFLSSFSILAEQDIRNMDPKDFVASAHAQVEVSLEEVDFKHGFVALRAGNFATNNANMMLDRSADPWTGHLLFPESVGDAITPIDMGRVGGTLLTSPPEAAEKGKRIYLLGPRLIRYDEQWDIIKRVSRKDIKVIVHENEPRGFANFLLSRGLPPPMVNNIVDQQVASRENTLEWFAHFDSIKHNIKKYSGYESTTFEDFVAGEKW